MKSYKFRGWAGEEMIYKINSISLINGELKSNLYKLMQYTGLKDKNGKEIYEGDIVLAYIGSFDSYKKYEVKLEFPICSPLNLINLEHPPEVIGNIYENPELIEEK